MRIGALMPPPFLQGVAVLALLTARSLAAPQLVIPNWLETLPIGDGDPSIPPDSTINTTANRYSNATSAKAPHLLRRGLTYPLNYSDPSNMTNPLTVTVLEVRPNILAPTYTDAFEYFIYFGPANSSFMRKPEDELPCWITTQITHKRWHDKCRHHKWQRLMPYCWNRTPRVDRCCVMLEGYQWARQPERGHLGPAACHNLIPTDLKTWIRYGLGCIGDGCPHVPWPDWAFIVPTPAGDLIKTEGRLE